MRKGEHLFNVLDRDHLLERLKHEEQKRTTLSFYRYSLIENPEQERDNLFYLLNSMGVLGRIYIAHEGVNAQVSIPSGNLAKLKSTIDSMYGETPFKIALEEPRISFLKLIIKVKAKIVADGLDDQSFDVTNIGTHLSASEFNQLMEKEDTVIVDMRNGYESKIGHFEGAILPEALTFRDELPLVKDLLADKKDQDILLYCTGGIRCEKASAYLKHHGFNQVYQLKGGIIDYVRQVKEQGLKSKFIGKNFVFDGRFGERVTGDVLAHCFQCDSPSDEYTNCLAETCHMLFIQCPACSEKYAGCCSKECYDFKQLPEQEQIIIRRNNPTSSKHPDQNKRNIHEAIKSPLGGSNSSTHS